MNNIPPKLRAEMAANTVYKTCLRQTIFKDHECQPNPMTGQLITWEHALYYAGKQINEWWAIIPICWWAHLGPGLNKKKNEALALTRKMDWDEWKGILTRYSRADFQARQNRAIITFGKQVLYPIPTTKPC